MTQRYDRKHLKKLLLERSVRLGDFTLSSGAKSSYYVDARRTTMTAEGQKLTRRTPVPLAFGRSPHEAFERRHPERAAVAVVEVV